MTQKKSNTNRREKKKPQLSTVDDKDDKTKIRDVVTFTLQDAAGGGTEESLRDPQLRGVGGGVVSKGEKEERNQRSPPAPTGNATKFAQWLLVTPDSGCLHPAAE